MDLNKQIGENLKKLRIERKMTAVQLADSSGISTVMLSQIEKGTANPTINTLWKIANGLKVPYTMLLEAPMEETRIVIPQEDKMQYSPDGKCRIFCYYPVSAQRKYELFMMRMNPGGESASPGHTQFSREYLIVSEGELEIQIENTLYQLKSGESLTFAASVPHIYKNISATETNVIILNDYTER